MSSYIYSQTGIGTETPNSKAELHIESNSKGVLIPRMTTTQMNNILTPAESLLIYNTTEKTFYSYDGASWQALNFYFSNVISDADGDTKIEVDKVGDGSEDIIHFYADGDENATNNGDADEVAELISTGFNLKYESDSYQANNNPILAVNSENTFVGATSPATISGDYNTFAGYNAGEATTTGANNAYVGHSAGENATTASENTFVGYTAGSSSGTNNLTGNQNIAIGYNAATTIQTTAQRNTIVGANSATSITTGASNIIVGTNSGTTLTTGANNILIGNSITTPTATTSNYLSIGDVITTDNAYSATGAVSFNKAYTFPTSSGVSGQTLLTDGSGALHWGDKNSASGGGDITVTGAAADLQPYNKISADADYRNNGDLILVPVTAMSDGSVSKVTTFIQDADFNCDIWLAIYKVVGANYEVLEEGGYEFRGKVSVLAGYNGFVTVDFYSGDHDVTPGADNQSTTVDVGELYYIGVYSTKNITTFIQKSDSDFQMKKDGGYGQNKNLPATLATSATSNEAKVVWARAH